MSYTFFMQFVLNFGNAKLDNLLFHRQINSYSHHDSRYTHIAIVYHYTVCRLYVDSMCFNCCTYTQVHVKDSAEVSLRCQEDR